MADFETQIKESQAQVAVAQAKISAITGRIEEARAKLDQGISIDVENATLEDVKKHPTCRRRPSSGGTDHGSG